MMGTLIQTTAVALAMLSYLAVVFAGNVAGPLGLCGSPQRPAPFNALNA
jgi:hypothetical protein